MDINNTNEELIEITESLPFVDETEPPTGETARSVAAYELTVPEDYVLAVRAGTPVAPEIRDVNGAPLDDSTRVIIAKADRQGNVISDAYGLDAQLSSFDYEKMRSDSDYFVRTNRTIVANSREKIMVFVVAPAGSISMDAATSHLTIGDNTTAQGKAVRLKETSKLSGEHQAALEQNGDN